LTLEGRRSLTIVAFLTSVLSPEYLTEFGLDPVAVPEIELFDNLPLPPGKVMLVSRRRAI
jgi:hypothetical protein